MMSVVYAESRNAESQYAVCCLLNVVILRVVMLNVVYAKSNYSECCYAECRLY